MGQYYTYILSNISDTLYYVGMTNDLVRRIYEHREKITKGYSSRYNLNMLLYYEIHSSPEEAIKREKQLQGWTRNKKKNLILLINPEYVDLWESIIK